jgi:predicted ferric reductase
MALLFLAILPLKRCFYEIFSKSHTIFAITILVLLWFHIHIPNGIKLFLQTPQAYLSIATTLYIFTSTVSIAELIYRNLSFEPQNTAIKRSSAGVCALDINVTRPWKFRAGQFIYLTIPKVSSFSIFESHPFYISSWKGDSITILIESRNGFTERLRLIPENRGSPPFLSTILSGPFGKGHCLEEFGTVILFCTGIGVTAHLPYIRELLEGYQLRKVKAKKIFLIWEVEKEGSVPISNGLDHRLIIYEAHEQWARDILQDLLLLDIGFVHLSPNKSACTNFVDS